MSAPAEPPRLRARSRSTLRRIREAKRRIRASRISIRGARADNATERSDHPDILGAYAAKAACGSAPDVAAPPVDARRQVPSTWGKG